MVLSRFFTLLKFLQNKQVTFKIICIRIYEQALRWRQSFLYPLSPGKYQAALFEKKYRIQNKLDKLDSSSIVVPTYYRYLYQQIYTHRIEILGSGPVHINQIQKDLDKQVPNSFTSVTLNVINALKKEYPTYSFIDWQRDVKSGFRWSACYSYRKQKSLMKGIHGADLKMPWELARCHHLVTLSVGALTDEENRRKFLKEFKCQVLDFIATNPVGYGVNWMSSMDVSIRAVNLLIAYDLLKPVDFEIVLDQSFDQLFSNWIYLHGLHISKNLEYNASLTGNHYLANVVGLLIISSFLEMTDKISGWLSFSIQEVFSEFEKQFNAEGSHFEGSTHYHKYCTEMVLWAVVFLLELDSRKIEALKNNADKHWKEYPKCCSFQNQVYSIENNQIVFPDWFQKRLYKAVKFINDIKKKDDKIPQIGDTDSGKFIPFTIVGAMLSKTESLSKYTNLKKEDFDHEKNYFDEDVLSVNPMLSLASAVFSCSSFKNQNTSQNLEYVIACKLTQGRTLNAGEVAIHKTSPTISSTSDWVKGEVFAYQTETVLYKDTGGLLDIENIEIIRYDQFGLCLIRSQRIYWLVRVSPESKYRYSKGHFHNDLLSFELNIDGQDIYIDPGTYIYTPDPNERNAYRSTSAHNTLYVSKMEQNDLLPGDRGLFYLPNDAEGRITEINNLFIECSLQYKQVKQKRRFIWSSNALIIKDYSSHPFQVNLNKLSYSNGYGKRISKNYKLYKD